MVPYIVSSVIYTESKESKGKKIGAYLFVNDNDRIAAAIIQILYMLRCCLAHGDITPDKKQVMYIDMLMKFYSVH